MTVRIPLPRIGTATAWRDAARRLLGNHFPPEEVEWAYDSPAQVSLFHAEPLPQTQRTVRVPKGFIDMANRVVWHSDEDRFDRLYAFLWRLKDSRSLMQDRGDPALAHLRTLEKNVNRCAHKMKAFVRFRDLRSDSPRRQFAAWFEPTHHTVEPTAGFFARRFADMDWAIVTPDVTARFEDGALRFEAGSARPNLPEDAAEALWATYFCNIFNPARVKISAMTSEMPRKYWKNMPETQHIPALLQQAEAKASEMQDAAPTLPPLRAEKIVERMQPARATALAGGLQEVHRQVRACTRCALCGPAQQAVVGEGSTEAQLMIVGEQPGDLEDQQGRPFVGPAGQVLDAALRQAGVARDEVYLTNAVKHFKFRQTGQRRIHQSPDRTEIEHCKWWLEAEIALVRPQVIVALGATAAFALTGRKDGIMKRRGQIEQTPFGPVMITAHPSWILRSTDGNARDVAVTAFAQDLVQASARLGQSTLIS